MTQPIQEPNTPRRLSAFGYGQNQLFRRPAPKQLGGTAIYAIEVFEAQTLVVAGDEAFEWEIPEDLDGAVLTKVEAYVTTVSSSGSIQVQIANEREAGGVVDMLSTKLTIDVGDKNSKDSAAPAVVDVANDDVVWGDHLRIDVDAAGTGSQGLGIIAYFTPAVTLALAVAGAQGEPGGVTDWTGAWSGATTYTPSQAVSNDGTSYVARVGSTAVEPGVTGGWQTYWQILSQGGFNTALTINVFGGGRILDVGAKTFVSVPFAGTIQGWTVLCDVGCSMAFYIWKDTYANWPPLIGDSITASDPPQTITASKATSTALTGWTTSVAAGDTLVIGITANDFARSATLSIEIART